MQGDLVRLNGSHCSLIGLTGTLVAKDNRSSLPQSHQAPMDGLIDHSRVIVRLKAG